MPLCLRATRTRFAIIALALLCGPSALLADVTPEQVWHSWQAETAIGGNTITAQSSRRAGDALILEDIKIEGQNGTEAHFGTMQFKDQGDGTVAVVLPDSFAVRLHLAPKPISAGFVPADLNLTLAMPGAHLVASGTPDAMSFTTDVPEFSLVLDSFDGIDVKTAGLAATLKLNGVSTRYKAMKGTPHKITADYAIKSLAFDFAGPDKGNDTEINLTAADLAILFDSALPEGATHDVESFDLPALVAAGYAANLTASLGATQFRVANRPKGAGGATKPDEVSGKLDKSSVRLAMDAATVDYGLDSTGGSFRVAGAKIPVAEAAMTYGDFAMHMRIPVAQSPKPAPFALGLSLTDVALSEPVWALVDPTKTLPHDPASLTLDAGGKATPQSNLFDKTASPQGRGAFQINTLDITTLNLKALGAEVTALGGLTMDYGTPARKKDPPEPSGKIDVKATGLTALLDGLVKMGVIPQNKAMQARMMLSIFAIASTTRDALTTTLEFRDAHFFVNGQQLQ